jgi:hypothetical protein
MAQREVMIELRTFGDTAQEREETSLARTTLLEKIKTFQK